MIAMTTTQIAAKIRNVSPSSARGKGEKKGHPERCPTNNLMTVDAGCLGEHLIDLMPVRLHPGSAQSVEALGDDHALEDRPIEAGPGVIPATGGSMQRSPMASAYAKALGLKAEKTLRRCLPNSSSTPTEGITSASSPSEVGNRL